MTRLAIALSGLLAALALSLPVAAQDTPAAEPQLSPEMQAMMAAMDKANRPGAQHKQLAEHFVGTWDIKQTIWMDPSAPPITETGKDVSTLVLGDRHVRSDFSSRFMGQPFAGVAMTSYDNVKGKYIGSWIDSVATGQFVAEGDYDAASKTYTFRSEMDDPMKPGNRLPVREVIRILGPDRHVMEWYETRDGQERKSMEIEYVRAK